MNRRLWFLNRKEQRPLRDFYPPVSGASVDDDDEDDESDDSDSDDDEKGETSKEGKEKVVFTPEQQAEINRIANKARKEGRKSGEKEAREQAEKETLEAQEKYKDLYEKSDGELKSLKPEVESLKEMVEAQSSAILEFINPMIDELPPLTQKLIRKHSAVEQIEMLKEHADELADTSGSQKVRVPASKTGKRKQEEQPLAKPHISTNRKRIAERLNKVSG